MLPPAQPTYAQVVAANPQIQPTWAPNADLSYGSDVIVFLLPASSTNVFVAEAGTGDLTGGSEPNWASAPSPGNTVSDNDYTWTNVGPQSSFPPTPSTWSPSTDYSAADTSVVLIWPTVSNGHLYAAYSGYFGNSDTAEPTFPAQLGHYTVDGDGYWQDLGPTAVASEKLVVIGGFDYQFEAAIWYGVEASTGAPVVEANKRKFGDDPSTDDVFHIPGSTRAHPDGDVFYSALYHGTEVRVQAFDRTLNPTAARYPIGGTNTQSTLGLSCDAAGFVYWTAVNGSNLEIHKLNKDLTLVSLTTWPMPADLGSRNHVSADGTKLYYLSNVYSIGVLDIAAGTYSNFTSSGPATLFGGIILVKANGNVVYVVVAHDQSISEYAPDGSLISTVSVPTIGSTEAAFDPDDQTHLWVGDEHSPAQLIHHFNISDGALLGSVPYTALERHMDPVDLVVIGAFECCEQPSDSPDPILALNPERDDTKTYNQALEEVADNPIEVDVDAATTLAPSAGGNVWTVYDVGSATTVREHHVDDVSPDPQLIRSCLFSVLLAELGGKHSFWQVSSCKFLTINRTTKDVILVEMKSSGGDYENLIGVVDTTYSLNLPQGLDGWPNADGTRLLYVEGNSLKLWNLEEDTFVRTIITLQNGIAFPVWLSDDSIIALTNWGGSSTPYVNANGADVVRFDLDGNLVTADSETPGLGTYTYNRATQLAGGLYGLTAVFGGLVCDGDGAGKIYLAGLMTDTQPGIMGINMLTGEVDDPVATAIPDAFLSVASGFCAVGDAANSASSSSTGNASDEGLPEKPDVSCAPGLLSTVSPNPGCNAGGRGFIPEYTGPSGTVPVITDPSTPENLLGQRSVFIQAEATHTDYETDGSETVRTMRFSVVELDDTNRVLGRVHNFGDIKKSMSDNQGNLTATQIDMYVQDAVDRMLAIMQGDDVTRFFNRDEIKVFARSDYGRRNNLTPVPIARGLLTDEIYDDGQFFRFIATSPFFTDGGSFDPDKKVPQWNYPLSFYTNAPPDLASKPMPIILGEVSDNGAKDPLTGLLNERGKCPGIFVGLDGIGTGPGSSAETWGRFNACLFAHYLITGVYGSDLGGMGLHGYDLVSDGKPKSTLTLTSRFGIDLSLVPTNGFAQIVVFNSTGRTEIRIIGKGANKIKVDSKVNQSDVTGASWYIARLDYQPRRVKLDINARNGLDLMIPKYSGYIRAKPFEDFICSEGDFRVTDFWVRDALLAAHLNGEPTIAFNMIGVEDKGEGNGLPIVDYFPALNWAIDNLVHVQMQRPSINISGELFWPQTNGDVPLWADGISKTKQSDYTKLQVISANSLGGYGLRISAYLGEGISTRDFMQLAADNGSCRFYDDGDGRIGVWMIDPDDDPTSWPRIEHVSRIFGDIKRHRAHSELRNVYQGGCDWDPETGKYKEELSPPLIDSEALRRNKGIRKYSKHIDGKFVADVAHFRNNLQHRLDLDKDGQVYVEISHGDIGFLDYPLGTGVLLTSLVGPGALGYRNRPLVVIEQTYHINDGTVSTTLMEIGYADLTEDGEVVSPTDEFIFSDDDDLAPIFSEDDDLAPVMEA